VSDPVELPVPETAESIPAALAAPKPGKVKRAKPVPAPVATAPEPVAEIVAAPEPIVEPTTVATPEPQPTAADPAETVIEEPIMATTIENVTAETTQKAQAHFADMNARAKDGMDKAGKLFAELNEFNKGNVEAMVESGRIAVAGVQSMAQDRAAYVREQFEQATAAARQFTSVKSPTEFVKLQGDYVRQQFDAMMADASRSTEAMLKLAGEIAQPISNRVAVAVEKVKAAA
jgi:phasin family protein